MTRLLILEDDIELTNQWQKALEPIADEIFVTHGAVQALAVIDSHEIDLCVVDLIVREHGKPKSDGGILFLGTLRTKSLDATERMPLILGVSGVDDKNIWIEAETLLKSFGSDEFLQKPFTDGELIDAIQRLLSSR